jgi:cell division control protein 6
LLIIFSIFLFLGQCYSAVKRALHTGAPKSLLCREKELETIRTFLQNHLSKEKPGSLYISGAPGTGKTACLTKVMEELEVSNHKTF